MTQGAQSGSAAPQTAGLTDEAQSLANNLARTAKDKATGLVEEQKAAAADQVEDVARVIENVAEEIGRGVPVIAPYLREAASSIHQVSTRLRESSTNDLLEDFGAFARRRPGTVVGVSLVAGFALARFLKSSADRRAASGQGAARARASGRAPAPTGRASSARPAGTGERSEADLANTPSPAAGMSSLADATSGSSGTSAAGGGAEAPEPRRSGSV